MIIVKIPSKAKKKKNYKRASGGKNYPKFHYSEAMVINIW